MTPTFRCVLLIDTPPGFEARPMSAELGYRSLGFDLTGGRNNDHALAAHLRELADLLDALTVPDPELI
jgi:hypothetical protein